MSLFDEVRRKVDSVEKKKFEERRHRQHIHKKQAMYQSRGPRVEIWVSADGTNSSRSVNMESVKQKLLLVLDRSLMIG